LGNSDSCWEFFLAKFYEKYGVIKMNNYHIKKINLGYQSLTQQELSHVQKIKDAYITKLLDHYRTAYTHIN
jgi:hypothetical protein